MTRFGIGVFHHYMGLTPELITALGGLIVALLGAIGTLYVAIQNGRKTTAAAQVASNNAIVAANTATASKDRIEEVHVLVNGNLTEQKKEIARLSLVIAQLTGTAGDVEKAAVSADQAKDSVKMSNDMMDQLTPPKQADP